MRSAIRTACWILVAFALAPAVVAIPKGWDVAASRLPWGHITPLVSVVGVLLVAKWIRGRYRASSNGAAGGRSSARRR